MNHVDSKVFREPLVHAHKRDFTLQHEWWVRVIPDVEVCSRAKQCKRRVFSDANMQVELFRALVRLSVWSLGLIWLPHYLTSFIPGILFQNGSRSDGSTIGSGCDPAHSHFTMFCPFWANSLVIWDFFISGRVSASLGVLRRVVYRV